MFSSALWCFFVSLSLTHTHANTHKHTHPFPLPPRKLKMRAGGKGSWTDGGAFSLTTLSW